MPTQQSAARSQHILVIDDQADICAIVQLGLEELGHYRVSVARTADQALPLLDGDRPDLVLLDAILPGMTGIEFAARAVSREIPVLLMTGEGAMETRLDSVGWPHLRKPFHLHELIAEIHAAIAQRHENTRIIRESIERLFRSAGDLRAAIARMTELRKQLAATTERSRRYKDGFGSC
jgi:two-component system phosphate regulon response regulator PhoB